jgi:hypothetical protein
MADLYKWARFGDNGSKAKGAAGHDTLPAGARVGERDMPL